MSFKTSKLKYLSQWKDRKNNLLRPNDAQGGLGYVDPEIIGLCDALNKLENVYTLQSCSGHSVINLQGEQYKYSGGLWLRLSKKVMFVFEANVYKLINHNNIEKINKIYREKEEKNIIDISFKGLEANLLDESSNLILKFFTEINNA